MLLLTAASFGSFNLLLCPGDGNRTTDASRIALVAVPICSRRAWRSRGQSWQPAVSPSLDPKTPERTRKLGLWSPATAEINLKNLNRACELFFEASPCRPARTGMVLAARSPLSAANFSSVRNNGGQGRNRTADASLFRAAGFSSRASPSRPARTGWVSPSAHP